MNDDCDSRRADPGSASATFDGVREVAASGLVVATLVEGGDWAAFDSAESAVHQAAATLSSVLGDLQPAGEITVVLTTDEHVSELNDSFRGKPEPTNVLSFPTETGKSGSNDGEIYLGDVILALETVLKEAQEQGIPPNHHLQHLVVHGLLHILGYDHDSDSAAEEMERLETHILQSLGIPDPYAADVENVTV